MTASASAARSSPAAYASRHRRNSSFSVRFAARAFLRAAAMTFSSALRVMFFTIQVYTTLVYT